MGYFTRTLWVTIVLALVCLTRWGLADDQSPATQPSADVKTGYFNTTYEERSPESSLASLDKRYVRGPDEPLPDYSLKDLKFNVYVPSNYDPGSPPGLVFWGDAMGSFPPEGGAVLDQLHLVLVAPQLWTNVVPWVQTGMILDAAYNIEKQYKVDPARRYLISVEDHHFVTFTASDVYKGYVSVRFLVFPGKFPVGPGQFLTAHDERMIPIDGTKKSPWVILYSSPAASGDYESSYPGGMKLIGFSNVMGIKVDPDEVKTPKLTDAWFKTAIAFLDRNQGKPKPVVNAPATKPVAAPAVASAQQIKFQIDMAKAYISSGKNDLAKAKLTDLIVKYPDDPSIAEAKALLAQIGQ